MTREFYDRSITKLLIALAIAAWICALSTVAMVFELHPGQQGARSVASVIPRHLTHIEGRGKEAALMSR